MCFLAQKSAEVTTGTISKSTRSSQRLTQVFNKSGCSVSMTWKQRVPAEFEEVLLRTHGRESKDVGPDPGELHFGFVGKFGVLCRRLRSRGCLAMKL